MPMLCAHWLCPLHIWRRCCWAVITYGLAWQESDTEDDMPDLVDFSDSDSDDMDGANWAHNGECWHAMGAVLRFI